METDFWKDKLSPFFFSRPCCVQTFSSCFLSLKPQCRSKSFKHTRAKHIMQGYICSKTQHLITFMQMPIFISITGRLFYCLQRNEPLYSNRCVSSEQLIRSIRNP